MNDQKKPLEWVVVKDVTDEATGHLLRIMGFDGSRRRGIGQVGRMLRKAAKRVKAKAKAKTTERLARRSPEDLAKLEDRIAKFVAKHPEGSRAEDIRDSLGLVTKEMPLPLANLLDAGRLRKKGEKRATTYFATKKR